MCGIVGVIAKYKGGLFKGQVDLFQQLFLVDQIRGMDGAGIITDTLDGISTLKAPFGAGAFMNTDPFKKAMELASKEGHFIIGHNRAATKGEHIWANTHPFVEGPISLVHNGTLFDHKNLDKDVVVDSHAICKHMAANGVKETLKEIDGAFALVWVNEDTYTLHLARNKERPLHLIETQTCWIISSELGLGLWMAERHKLQVKDSFQLAVETLYSFDLEKPFEFTTEKVEYYKWGYLSNYGSWKGGAATNDDDASTPFKSRRMSHKQKMKQEKEAEKSAVIIPFAGTSPLHKEYQPPTHSYGARIKFQPSRLDAKDPSSSIILDTMQNRHFVIGRVNGEPNTEVRVYGNPNHLAEYIHGDILEGTVNRTSIKGKRTTYELTAVIILPAAPHANTVANEVALMKYCDNNGLLNDPNTLIKCDCCETPTKRSIITMRAGKPLCYTCNTAFAENTHLAEEFGYK